MCEVKLQAYKVFSVFRAKSITWAVTEVKLELPFAWPTAAVAAAAAAAASQDEAVQKELFLRKLATLESRFY